MPVPLANQIDEVVRSVVGLVTSRPGRLVVLTVAGPTEALPRLRERLARVGIADVELQVRESLGPVRVLSLEFER